MRPGKKKGETEIGGEVKTLSDEVRLEKRNVSIAALQTGNSAELDNCCVTEMKLTSTLTLVHGSSDNGGGFWRTGFT